MLDMALQFLVSPALLHAHQFFVLLYPLDSFNLTMYIGSSLVSVGSGGEYISSYFRIHTFRYPGRSLGKPQSGLPFRRHAAPAMANALTPPNRTKSRVETQGDAPLPHPLRVVRSTKHGGTGQVSPVATPCSTPSHI